MEHVSINGTDGYVEVDARLDPAHRDVIAEGVVAPENADAGADAPLDDISVDTVPDVVIDGAADAAPAYPAPGRRRRRWLPAGNRIS